MGSGIVETAAARGLRVVALEIDPRRREAAAKGLRERLDRAVAKGRLTRESADELWSRITWAGEMSEFESCSLVVEAVVEMESVKRDVLAALDRICPPGTLFTSNTSSISIARLAEATGRPDRFAGMHFFNPVPVMTPVEIVRGPKTSDATVAAIERAGRQLGKNPFVVNDAPGFVVNRVLMPLINEAAWTLHSGIADAATIDELMKQGCNHPMGPLALADLVGLDVCLFILQVLHRELGSKFVPCPLFEQHVAAGRLGRKSGSGFHTYDTRTG
jgi:3-hydroxybutyryl-CoA dehydrogenase